MTAAAVPPAPGLGFRRHLRARTVPGDATYLHSGEEVVTLRGPHLETLVPLLDGSRTITGIVDAAAPALGPAEVAHGLRDLAAAGVLVEAAAAGPAEQATAAFWDLAAVPDPAVRASGRVRVVTVGPVARARGAHDRARRSLAGAGVEAPRTGQGAPSLVVVLCDDLLDPALARIEARTRRRGIPWVPVRVAGAAPSVGPFLDPSGPGPCHDCLVHWVGGLRDHVEPGFLPSVGLPAVDEMLLGLLALACGARLRGARHAGHDAILRVDPVRPALTEHRVRARPECRTCGRADADRRVGSAPGFRSRRRPPGATRSHTAEEAASLLAPLVDPVVGPVVDEGPVELAAGTPLWSWRSRAAAPASARRGTPVRCAGVAPDREGARLSALAEAVERHSGAFHGDEPRQRAALVDLPDAIHPDDVQLWSAAQYGDRTGWNARHEPPAHVGVPFDADAPTDWTSLWSLSAGRPRPVATGLLYHGAPRAGGSLVADSSGAAAGVVLEDAALAGLLELVERDAVAIWWYTRMPVPGIDVDGARSAWVREFAAAARRTGRRCWALDLTVDLGVPVVAALTADDDDGGRIAFGFGAHPDPDRALDRAVAECHQLATTFAAVAPGTAAHRWWHGARTSEHPHLSPAPVRPAERAVVADVDVLADLDAVRGRVEDAGMEVLLLDQTRPSVGVPVVRMVVPGLRSMRPRFAPGRLFDVPVGLGRLSSAPGPDALNPVPLFV